MVPVKSETVMRYVSVCTYMGVRLYICAEGGTVCVVSVLHILTSEVLCVAVLMVMGIFTAMLTLIF